MTLIPDLQRDLVEAADRIGGERWPARVRVAMAVSAAAVIAALVLVLGGGSADSPSQGGAVTPSPAADRPGEPPPSSPPEPPKGDPPEVIPAPNPPRPDVHPVPGSQSETLEVVVAGRRYSITGYRSEDSVCTSLTEAGPGPAGPPTARTCLSERLLRQALANDRVHMYGGGGGGPTFSVGFARDEVAEISLADPAPTSQVVLSDPWRPEPWEGAPIRFVYVITDGRPETMPRFDEHNLRPGIVVESGP